jgi:AraC-like DNA-binding protein
MAMPATLRSAYVADFTGSQQTLSFGAIGLLRTDNSAISVHRTLTHVRRSDPEAFFLLVNLGGIQRVSQGRDEVLLAPDDMVVIHSSRTLHTESAIDLPRQQGLIVTCDPAALEIPPGELGRIAGRRLDGTDGLSGLLSSYLASLAAVGGSLQAADAMRLSSATLDLMSVTFGRVLGVLSGLSSERIDRERAIRIQHFMRQNLGDPNLTPEAIASAHYISLRTLQRLFQAYAGTTVARWIRERRLAGFRADLLDLTLQSRSVHSLAARWGFTDLSHVSRAFKAAYGEAPAAYRARNSAQPS